MPSRLSTCARPELTEAASRKAATTKGATTYRMRTSSTVIGWLRLILRPPTRRFDGSYDTNLCRRQMAGDIGWQIERASVDFRRPVSRRPQYANLGGARPDGFHRCRRQRGIFRRPAQGHETAYIGRDGGDISGDVREERP